MNLGVNMKKELIEALDDDVCVSFEDDLSFDEEVEIDEVELLKIP